MARRAALLLVVIATVALTACVGSTEPATNVTFDGATLNARGTANDGPANSYFEYWVDAFPGHVERATFRDPWPAGASGPFSLRIGQLYAGTTYRFRLCGSDVDEEPAICAQTRSFTTPPAPRDAVRGGWVEHDAPGAAGGYIDATAGPPGRPPTGSFYYNTGFSPGGAFTGFVTCLVVSGERAVVGAVGQFDDASGGTQPATTLAWIVVHQPGDDNRVLVRGTMGSTRPSCASAAPTNGIYASAPDLVVWDGP